jgi:hypothetical protein
MSSANPLGLQGQCALVTGVKFRLDAAIREALLVTAIATSRDAGDTVFHQMSWQTQRCIG